jgi:hypothetical protein
MSDPKKDDGARLEALGEWYDLVLTLPELRSRYERIEAQRADVPPQFRSAFGLLLHHLDDWIDAIVDNDPEGRVAAQSLLRTGPAWMHRPENLQEIRSYIALEEEGDVTKVVIEWHRVPPDLREATISLASMVVDASEGRFRPGGRPRKNQARETG